ncbi:hypothetical protein SLS57_002767 [Botryosphaeria dothidea]
MVFKNTLRGTVISRSRCLHPDTAMAFRYIPGGTVLAGIHSLNDEDPVFDYYDDVLAQDAEDSDDDGDPQPSTKIEEDEWTMGEDVDQVQDYEEDEWIMGEGDGQDQGWEDDDDDDDEEEEEEEQRVEDDGE